MSPTAAATLPTIGKTANRENFPVASLLLPRSMRRPIMAFYRFARTADDIADDPRLEAEDKLSRLDALEEGLEDRRSDSFALPALALREAVASDPLLLAHAALLLQAFRRDAVTDHCRDWLDLMTYCRFSAVPVGRFLLDLHTEPADAMPAADALCIALQILNHLQDCGLDYRDLGRVYLPRDWMLAEGVKTKALAGNVSPPGLRRVIDRTLDGVDGLLELAAPLPSRIADRRLRLEAAVTLSVAEKLAALLRRADPLASPVKLSPFAYAEAFAAGLARGLR